MSVLCKLLSAYLYSASSPFSGMKGRCVSCQRQKRFNILRGIPLMFNLSCVPLDCKPRLQLSLLCLVLCQSPSFVHQSFSLTACHWLDPVGMQRSKHVGRLCFVYLQNVGFRITTSVEFYKYPLNKLFPKTKNEASGNNERCIIIIYQAIFSSQIDVSFFFIKKKNISLLVIIPAGFQYIYINISLIQGLQNFYSWKETKIKHIITSRKRRRVALLISQAKITN